MFKGRGDSKTCGHVLVAIVRKRLSIEASLYTLMQVFSVAIFEKVAIIICIFRNCTVPRAT